MPEPTAVYARMDSKRSKAYAKINVKMHQVTLNWKQQQEEKGGEEEKKKTETKMKRKRK